MILVYDDIPNLGLTKGSSSLKLFWLANFRADNIQLPADHKRSGKTNKSRAS